MFYDIIDDHDSQDPVHDDPDDRVGEDKRPVTTGETALALAREQLGKPYQWGSRGPSSFDCSGLIIWSYRNTVPGLMFRYQSYVVPDATMDSLWRYNVRRLGLSEIQPGDIIFITSRETRVTHGGLFIRWLGSHEMEILHSSSAMGGVVIESWPVFGLKRGQWFHGAGRLEISTRANLLPFQSSFF